MEETMMRRLRRHAARWIAGGVNGRRCVTCHEPANNVSVSAASVRARFEATGGTDPIFRTHDGSNSPLADVSTVEARRAAYSLLLSKGVIRVGLPIPAGAEFELAAVDDPAGYAGDNANGNELSLFRRPPPSTNLGFLSAVMWDGRETLEKGSAAAIHFDVAHQANGAKVVTDPGRAPITGRWADVGRFKGPILRGLAGRAPYFHNGSAATLADVVDFYDRRFALALTPEEKADVVAFRRAP